MASLLVTGDIILDCHLYGGAGMSAAPAGRFSTRYRERLGGAVLTLEILKAAAQDRMDVHSGLVTQDLDRTMPEYLRSYGVWRPHPVRRGAKDHVWRCEPDFGYGPVQADEPRHVFEVSPPPSPAALTLLDDLGILFRHIASRSAWPDFTRGSGHYLLKTSWPLCRGDLWDALAPARDRLIVLVAADDLRREDARIDSRLSWEQTAEHTKRALQNDPLVCGLLEAAHVIVSFRSEGALLAHRRPDGSSAFRLIFDPATLEGDHARDCDGFVYGFQTCFAAAIAYRVMQGPRQDTGQAAAGKPGDLFADPAWLPEALAEGVAAGLAAKRQLLELGHGRVDDREPRFPIDEIGKTIAAHKGGFVQVDMPGDPHPLGSRPWSILEQAEIGEGAIGGAGGPSTGLAQLTARYGFGALSHVPALQLGKLFTADRSEIESFRMLYDLIRRYEEIKVQRKPLSIGVFGPPGAGKSFGVKALAKAILGDQAPFLEFNLSQFKSPDELIGAFHQVRDAVLGGITPVAFWDEFDSQDYTWLQYLLAPMQDGSFQEGQITHPLGKCIFVFAGGTSPSFAQFGVPEPAEPTDEELAPLEAPERVHRRQAYEEKAERFRQYKLIKGPDFLSRLHGFLDVLGPNERTGEGDADITWPIRRAILLRGILGLKGSQELDMDPGLLRALLGVSSYRHGARSFEKILLALMHDRQHGHLHRSALLPRQLLERETDAGHFQKLLVEGDAFKGHPDIDQLAAAIHYFYLPEAERMKIAAEVTAKPGRTGTVHPAIKAVFDSLSPDFKASNRAAARRIPDHLALIDFVVRPRGEKTREDWRQVLEVALRRHLERLAQQEHIGWCLEREANGWRYGETRNNEAKRHPALVPWGKLAAGDQEKDRKNIQIIPAILELAGHVAEKVAPPAP